MHKYINTYMSPTVCTYISCILEKRKHTYCSILHIIYMFCVVAYTYFVSSLTYTLKSLLWPIKASLDAIICKMHEVKLDGGGNRNAPSSVQQHWFDKPYILYVRWQHAFTFLFPFSSDLHIVCCLISLYWL